MVRASAPAKINLSLKVTGRRDDGYHFIHTVMQAVSVRETVELKKNGKSGIDLSMTGAKLSPDVTNIAYRAADAFFEYTGIKAFGIDIKIHKTVPIGAGLAGGSADAAAVLAGLNALADARLPVSELCKIGAQVGADVPFCISGDGAGNRCRYRPERPSAHTRLLFCYRKARGEHIDRRGIPPYRQRGQHAGPGRFNRGCR